MPKNPNRRVLEPDRPKVPDIVDKLIKNPLFAINGTPTTDEQFSIYEQFWKMSPTGRRKALHLARKHIAEEDYRKRKIVNNPIEKIISNVWKYAVSPNVRIIVDETGVHEYPITNDGIVILKPMLPL